MKYMKGQVLIHTLKVIIRTLIVGCLFLVFSACGEDLTPEQHVEKAKIFMSEKKIFSGIIELKNALQKEGNLPEARWLMGEAYLKLGEGRLANREFNSAQSLGYSNDELETNLLRGLNLQGEFQQVLDKVEKIENTAEIMVIRGDAQLGLGQAEQARQTYQQALALEPATDMAYTGLARVALSSRDLVLARKHIDKGLAVNPDNDDLHSLKGMLGLIENKPEEAAAALKQAIEIAPYNRVAQVGLVRALYAQNKFEEAEKPLKTLQNRYANAPTVKYLRAYLEIQNGNIEKAEELLQDVLKSSPNHPESLLLLSNLLYKEGKLERVISYMQSFTNQFPEHLPATKLLAVAYLGQNEIDKTIELIQKALQTQTADDQLYSILGTAYIRSGNMAKATEYLEQASEINPNAATIRAQLALSHLASGKTDLAVSALEDAVQLNPKLYSADIMLILTHIRSRNYDDAIKAAENLNKKEPDNPLPLNLLGTAYAGKEDYEKAREYFYQALEKNQEYTPARFNLASLEIEQKRYDIASDLYLEIVATDKKNAKAYVGLARIASLQNDEAAMFDYLKQARVADEKSVEARILLARYYKNNSDYSKMLEVIEEAAIVAPNYTQVIFLTGQAQRLNGIYDKALKNLELLVTEFPDAPEIVMEFALLQRDMGDLAAARESLEKVLSLVENHERALLTLINLHLRTNEPDMARELSEQYAAAYPESADLQVAYGDIELHEKNYPKALTHYQAAIEINDLSFIAFRIVNTYLAMNETEKAREVLENWVNDHPDDKRVKLVLASRYHQEKNEERAIQLYEEVIRDDASNMIALNNLAFMYLGRDPARAMDLAERAYQIAPEQAEVIDTFGWILIQQGSQLERGVQMIQKAMEKKPDEPSIQFHYAYGLAKSGDRTRALTLLEKVLEEYKTFPDRTDAEKLMVELKN